MELIPRLEPLSQGKSEYHACLPTARDRKIVF